MRLFWSVRSLAIIGCLIVASREARAESGADLCTPPKMQTEKWPTTEQVGGVTLLLPPGFRAATSGVSAARETYFVSGHREIIIGRGSAPTGDAITTTGIEKLPATQSSEVADNSPVMTQLSSCQTTINGRQVEITLSSLMDHRQSAGTGESAGSFYRMIARFLPAAPAGEMFIAFETDSRSEISNYRQLFWTVTFDGSTPSSVSAKPAAPACVPKADRSLPTSDAVLDTGLVQSLFASSGPVPHGFALMSLTFDGKGALTGIAVPQSDLPEPAQRQLATLVASNLKPHDKHTPSSYTLRVDAADTGLRYTVQGACGP